MQDSQIFIPIIVSKDADLLPVGGALKAHWIDVVWLGDGWAFL